MKNDYHSPTMAQIFQPVIYINTNMKTSIRISTTIVLFLVAGMFTATRAQKLVFLFAHGQYATPVQTDFKNSYSMGLGAEAGLGVGLGKTFFTGTIGYTFFNAKSGTEAGNITYAPVKLGIRHYLLPGNLLFIHADAGVAHIKDKTTNTSYSGFTGDVGAGVKLGPFELGVAYDGFSRSDPSGYASWLAFKAGWKFGL